jgi:ABC-type transport system involved in multi-copper enzyme maturation permease subunit
LIANPLRNPILLKEVRTRLRTRSTLAVLSLYLLVVATVVVVYLVQRSGSGVDRTAHAGIPLLQALAIAQLWLLLLIAPLVVAGAISGERQQRTWDLLVITASSFRIVWGKFLAAAAFNLLLLCAAVPSIAAVFLFGGIVALDLVRAYLVLIMTVLLLTSAGLLISALTPRPLISAIFSVGIGVALGIGLCFATGQPDALTDPTGFSASSTDPTPAAPLAQLDPVLALLSALSNGSGGTLLGDAGAIHHAFGLPLQLPLWGAFAVLALILTAICLAAAAGLVRVQFVVA